MYAPFFRISNQVLKNIGEIEAAKETIDNAPLVPSFEKQFQTDAVFRTVYHGTHIEGNDLTVTQTKKVLEGQSIYAKPRDIQEVINYRNVVKLLDELKEKNGDYNLKTLLKIHQTTVFKVVPPGKSGVLRDTQVIIREEGTGKIIFRPPPAVEVPYLLEDFFDWLESKEGKEVHPILRAAIAHYVLVAVHPFVEGNGRAARAFTSLILLREKYDIKRFFAMEEYFDKDLSGYYEAFFLVDKQSENIAERDLTPWLEYFTQVLATELVKIKEKVRKISVDTRLKVKYGQQIALTERQMRLIEYLSDLGQARTAQFKKILPMISEDTILRDLNDLIKKGIIKKHGRTKSAYYAMAKP